MGGPKHLKTAVPLRAPLLMATVASAQQHARWNSSNITSSFNHDSLQAADRMSIKLTFKVCSVAVLLLLVFAALGPEKWVPRSGFGWRIDHFVGYFAVTFCFCLAWSRPVVVGAALMALAVLLEGMQAFTPDRHADLLAALISAGGATAAVLPAELFIQALRRITGISDDPERTPFAFAITSMFRN